MYQFPNSVSQSYKRFEAVVSRLNTSISSTYQETGLWSPSLIGQRVVDRKIAQQCRVKRARYAEDSLAKLKQSIIMLFPLSFMYAIVIVFLVWFNLLKHCQFTPNGDVCSSITHINSRPKAQDRKPLVLRHTHSKLPLLTLFPGQSSAFHPIPSINSRRDLDQAMEELNAELRSWQRLGLGLKNARILSGVMMKN